MLRTPRVALSKGIVVLALILALTLAAVGTASAAPLTGNRTTSSHSYCYRAIVTLHGSNPATVNCLVKDKPTGVTPDTGTYTCGPNLPSPWIALYQDAWYGGAQICFVGVGFANLNDYHINVFQTWANQTSSFDMGAVGTLFQGANGNGATCQFQPGTEASYINDYCGSGWNDKTQSFFIAG